MVTLILDYLAILHHRTAPTWLPIALNLLALVAGLIAIGILA